MTKTEMLQSHYLPLDAYNLILRHPIVAGLALFVAFSAAAGFLRHRFGRGGGDIFATALFVAVIAVFTAACLYLLVHQGGYRVLHPGF